MIQQGIREIQLVAIHKPTKTILRLTEIRPGSYVAGELVDGGTVDFCLKCNGRPCYFPFIRWIDVDVYLWDGKDCYPVNITSREGTSTPKEIIEAIKKRYGISYEQSVGRSYRKEIR